MKYQTINIVTSYELLINKTISVEVKLKFIMMKKYLFLAILFICALVRGTRNNFAISKQ